MKKMQYETTSNTLVVNPVPGMILFPASFKTAAFAVLEISG